MDDIFGNIDLNLRYERDTGLKAIHVDEDNDGKIDAVLIPESAAQDSEAPVRGFNVDLGADGTIDGFAEFIRNQNDEVKSIRFRQLR